MHLRRGSYIIKPQESPGMRREWMPQMPSDAETPGHGCHTGGSPSYAMAVSG